MKTGTVRTSALAGVIGLMLASVAGAEEWKFAIEEIPGSIMDSYAQEFKSRVEAATGGDVPITPPLNHEQLQRLRRKLKAKFH